MSEDTNIRVYRKDGLSLGKIAKKEGRKKKKMFELMVQFYMSHSASFTNLQYEKGEPK